MTHTFHCSNRKCGEYQRNFTAAMSATDYRRATGASIRCAFCNHPVSVGAALTAEERETARQVLLAIDRGNGGCWDGVVH